MIVDGDLTSVAMSKKDCAYPAYDLTAATIASSSIRPPLHALGGHHCATLEAVIVV